MKDPARTIRIMDLNTENRSEGFGQNDPNSGLVKIEDGGSEHNDLKSWIGTQ